MAVSVFLGVWIGLMPTLGVALVLTAIAAQIARVPKGPGLLASFIAVPPTLFFFFYPLGYFGVGLPLVQPATLDFDFLAEVERLNLMNAGAIAERLWQDARGHLIAFMVGMIVVATGTGLLAFAGTYTIMERKRRARLERRRQRRLERETMS